MKNLLSFALVLCLTTAQLIGQCLTAPGSGDITGNVSFGDPINWANPNRVEASDELKAHARLNAGDTTKYLWVSDFDFLMPAGATLTGIEVYVEKSMDVGADVRDASVRLIKGGVISGEDKAGASGWTATDNMTVYGDPNDLWGQTWTPADIMSEDFGVVISVTRGSGASNLKAYIDYIGIVIHFDNAGGGCALPILLSGFNATDQGDGTVRVDWTTLREENNLGFVVERSQDGSFFEPVAEIAAAGSGTEAQSYSIVDDFPPAGQLFYRLRQRDVGGESSYSEVVAVTVEGSALQVGSFPNPATDQVTLRLRGLEGDANWQLLDLSGRQVMAGQAYGEGDHVLAVSGLARGLYLLRVDGPLGQSHTEKLLLQ